MRREDVRTVGHRLPDMLLTLRDAAGARYQIPGGATVAFRMVNTADGQVKIDNAAATSLQTGAETYGDVSYAFAAGDVDTAGRFWAWFVVTAGGKTRLFPPMKSIIIDFVAAS